MAAAVEFDFTARQERAIPAEAVSAACQEGRCCWLDIDTTDRAAAEALLRDLDISRVAIEEALGVQVDSRHDVYETCLHVTATAVTLRDGRIHTSQVDLLIGERYIVTLHKGPVEFLEQVRRTYRQDFLKFAKTLGFVLYEIWDHLIDSYRKGIAVLDNEVEQVQARIFGDVDDQIFNYVARVTQELLQFRKIILGGREVLHELAVRRSPFVPESTQPFLDNMVGKLERLGSDLTVEREILAETLNLYMGIVSHRTNKVVNRLTVLSMIFLPLTFLCGVYGMNFRVLPELEWQYGYVYFWLLSGATAIVLLTVMKLQRWL